MKNTKKLMVLFIVCIFAFDIAPVNAQSSFYDTFIQSWVNKDHAFGISGNYPNELGWYTVPNFQLTKSSGSEIVYYYLPYADYQQTKIIQALVYYSSNLNTETWVAITTQSYVYHLQIQMLSSQINFRLRRDLTTYQTLPSFTRESTVANYWVEIIMSGMLINSNGYMGIVALIRVYTNDRKELLYSQSTNLWENINLGQRLSDIGVINTYYTPNTNIRQACKYVRIGYQSDRIFTSETNLESLSIATKPIDESEFGSYDPENPNSETNDEFPDIPNTIKLNYASFRLKQLSNPNIIYLTQNYSVYNKTINDTENKEYTFNYSFYSLEIYSKNNVYYIYTQYINPDSWGNWEIVMFEKTIIESRINFNWIRNLMVFLVNAIVMLFQSLLFLLIIAFNYLIIWLLFQIIVLIWNYPIYWIVYAIVGIVFWISFFFIWILNELVILWELIIEPIIIWIWNETVAILKFVYNWLFKQGGLQTLVNLYLTLVSYILAIIFFVLTAGLINFTETQQAMAEFLIQLNSVFFQIGSIFISNFPLLIGYSGTYILLVGLVYLKYIYAKSRGYTQRATKLQSMINVYKLPMVLIIRLSQYIIGFIQGGVPTDGADE